MKIVIFIFVCFGLCTCLVISSVSLYLFIKDFVEENQTKTVNVEISGSGAMGTTTTKVNLDEKGNMIISKSTPNPGKLEIKGNRYIGGVVRVGEFSQPIDIGKVPANYMAGKGLKYYKGYIFPKNKRIYIDKKANIGDYYVVSDECFISISDSEPLYLYAERGDFIKYTKNKKWVIEKP